MEERVTTLLAQNKALAEEHCHLGDLLHDAQEDEYARARARQWQADMLTTLRAILVAVTRGEEG
jgi:hypothetical protein